MTNAEALVGRVCIVIERVAAGAGSMGRVKIDGDIWLASADAHGGEHFEAGDNAFIQRLEASVLIITKQYKEK